LVLLLQQVGVSLSLLFPRIHFQADSKAWFDGHNALYAGTLIVVKSMADLQVAAVASRFECCDVLGSSFYGGQ
jgi:hypothetical protein